MRLTFGSCNLWPMTTFRLHALSLLTLLLAGTHAALAAPLHPQIDITNYVINADLDPASGKLTATAAVTFTSLDDITTANFDLNRSLQVTAVYLDKQHPPHRLARRNGYGVAGHASCSHGEEPAGYAHL